MTGQERTKRGGLRWPTLWVAGTTALTAVLPLTVADRLPDPLATHWRGSTANGSMPLWAACLVPALIWAVLGAAGLLALRRVDGLLRVWNLAGLLAGGVLFLGLQTAAVRANLDRTDWHGAELPVGWFLGTLAAALLTGAAVRLLGGRGLSAAAPPAPAGPVLELAEDERLVWFSRAANRPLQVVAAVSGPAAAVVLLGAATGLFGAGWGWPLFAVLAVVGLSTACCFSVRVRVSEAGLEVALGPFGLPTRRWALSELDSARVERRLPSQVGGWGYRLNGLGTTVMLRSGPCLVVRVSATGHDFAVSVDDAERGAALLNALRARQSA
ncbi:hypothetical protein Kpho02_14020 [Kitasatospora phosalacinea]|uniref:DUF1648 domain-containing protein n=1 Tax=Kitasatospora phosalacinea TaxID=2065 RepID=A0A9W6Q5X0_9ACTN|nr:DUF1648 domain-containing protein [Kitasatospora phosalacinea]GLW69103.1 hypothetical protein Kpho02_14020 [Kitasatospora phosalacinea]